MSRKFAAFAAFGLLALSAGPALPEQGGNTAAIQNLDTRLTALEGTVGTLQGEVGTNTESIGLLDQTVSDILLTLTGVQDQLDGLDERLTTVEGEILSPLFNIVLRSSSHVPNLGGFIYQDCEVGEMALGGRVSQPDEGDSWVVNEQGFHWAGDGDWATGWAANVIAGTGEDVQIAAVCAEALEFPGFGVNPLTNS